MKAKQILIIIAVVVIGALLLLMFRSSSNESLTAVVTLSATTDKTSYSMDEEINLNLNLSNIGGIETCVSDMGASSLRFISFTRNGEEVIQRSAPSYFITSYPEMLENSLSVLASGDEIDISLSSYLDAGLGAQALKTTALENGRGMSTFYNVSEPGNYELELVYEYSGPSADNCPNVFGGPSNSATVTFTVTP